MRKQLVFINQSAGYLMIDIINQFSVHHPECVLITGTLNPRNNALSDQVAVDKIIAYDRSSTLKRLVSWTWASIQIFFKILLKYRKAEIFIVSNPPFTTFLPLLLPNPFSLLIYDVYPDALVEYKMLGEKSLLVRGWEAANRKVFAKAKKIFTISEGMRERLSRYAAHEQAIQVVPVWTDNSFFGVVPKEDNPFLQEHGLAGKFVVLYSGNLGHTHPVEVLVKLAKQMSQSDVFFLIIGEGEKEKLIRSKIEEYELKNCKWLPWQPTEILPYSFAAADVAVVTLGKEASHLSIPSKTFNYLSVGAPIMSIASEGSELQQLIKRHEVGNNFDEDDLALMEDFILRLSSDQTLHQRFRSNAREASNYYGPENAALFLNPISSPAAHDL